MPPRRWGKFATVLLDYWVDYDASIPLRIHYPFRRLGLLGDWATCLFGAPLASTVDPQNPRAKRAQKESRKRNELQEWLETKNRPECRRRRFPDILEFPHTLEKTTAAMDLVKATPHEA